jgi:hypothetical protein
MGGWSHQAICPLLREHWLKGCLGVEPRRVGITLAEGLYDFGGKFWQKAAMIWAGGPCPFFELYSGIRSLHTSLYMWRYRARLNTVYSLTRTGVLIQRVSRLQSECMYGLVCPARPLAFSLSTPVRAATLQPTERELTTFKYGATSALSYRLASRRVKMPTTYRNFRIILLKCY